VLAQEKWATFLDSIDVFLVIFRYSGHTEVHDI
jgi:hypothetical protein